MRGLEKNCTRWRTHTHRQTDGHGDSMTNSAQWSRVGENVVDDESFFCVFFYLHMVKKLNRKMGKHVNLERNKTQNVFFTLVNTMEAFKCIFLKKYIFLKMPCTAN